MKKTGFTLAEVLITLAIIGVVAAMTIPTLMTNTTASQFKTAYKKAVSSLKQAITLNTAVDDFDFRVLHNSADATAQAHRRSFASIIGARMEGAKHVNDIYFDSTGEHGNDGTETMVITGDHTCVAADMVDGADNKAACTTAGGVGKVISGANNTYTINGTTFIVFQLADGTVIGYHKDAEDCVDASQENCVGFVDTNGIAGPNRVTECDTAGSWTTSCVVSNDHVFDIFPIKFYNQSVEPGSVAAASILYGYKTNQ